MLPNTIDCRPDAILQKIGPDASRFALILIDIDPGTPTVESRHLSLMLDQIFDLSDIKIWLSENKLLIISSHTADNDQLCMAVKEVEQLIQCKTGVVFYPEDGKSIRTLTTKAYEAVRLRMNVGVKRALTKAMEDNEFFMVYQPQVNTKTGIHTGVEALIRWQPAGQEKIIMPMEFLPLAEAEGMMDQICKWTLYEACRQCLAWQACEGRMRIGVNISTTYLLNPRFIKDLDQVIDETGVDSTLLEIEVTENKGIHRENVGQVNDVIQKIRNRGIMVSLDDFGMEYNSLEVLRVLTVDRIKIDKVFVQNLDQEKVRYIVQATIGLAMAMGMECIAEGVETSLQATLLEKMGCYDMQGYLIGRPQKKYPKWKTIKAS